MERKQNGKTEMEKHRARETKKLIERERRDVPFLKLLT